MTTVKLSIVIPVYKSATILPNLIKEIEIAMDKLGLLGEFQLVLVNDASPDKSWSVIKDLLKGRSYITAISLMKNFGQHNAIMAGLKHVKGEVVVLMDDDLQHPPSQIQNLLQEIKKGADVCYVKYKNRQHPAWKKIGSAFNNWMATKLLDKPAGLYLSSFKALDQKVILEILKYEGPFTYIDGLILDVTRSINTVEIEHHERADGTGNYNFKKSISLWLKMATSFSIFPLRLASIIGSILALLSGILIIETVIQRLQHPEWQAGWASLFTVILFLGAAQLSFIGIVGEYLGRAYLPLNKKPQYAIKEILK